MRSAFEVEDVVEEIVNFLLSVGITVRDGEVADDSFLPGLLIERGELVVDRSKLSWPGDLLHEAGHIAITPAASRRSLSDALNGQVEQHTGEAEASAWAYAACVSLGIDVSVLFHSGGYHGKSAALVATFSVGVYPGCAGLAKAGLTFTGIEAVERGVAPYPHMINWLRS